MMYMVDITTLMGPMTDILHVITPNVTHIEAHIAQLSSLNVSLTRSCID